MTKYQSLGLTLLNTSLVFLSKHVRRTRFSEVWVISSGVLSMRSCTHDSIVTQTGGEAVVDETVGLILNHCC